jgi:hypothetical protein
VIAIALVVGLLDLATEGGLLGLAAEGVAQPPDTQATESTQSLPVNWLYGAYIPKDLPLTPLSGAERRELWLRQTLLTPGIYFKTMLFAVGDQIDDSPADWNSDVGAFGQRLASRHGQFTIQTSIAAAGNWALGYEPRYERCRCSGTWPRVRHALVRNFLTYDRTEHERRPQIAMYAGAWAAGLIASTWKPPADDLWQMGYQSVITQVVFGSMANLVGEFAVEIGRLLGRQEPGARRDGVSSDGKRLREMPRPTGPALRSRSEDEPDRAVDGVERLSEGR